MTSISNASFSNIKAKVERLKNELSHKLSQKSAQMLRSSQPVPTAQQLKASGYVNGNILYC